MAKAGFIFHGARGKVGNQVLARGEKGTVQREYVIPSNPKTLAQAKQRMAFAMATSAAAGLKFIVNHSFENISGEKENVREFVRLNSKMLRAQIENALNEGTNGQMVAQIMGAKGMQPANYILSRGSVYFPQYAIDAANNGVKYAAPTGSTTALNATVTDYDSYKAALADLGLVPGDQISIVVLFEYFTTIAEYQGESNNLCKAIGARATFKTVLPEGFSGKIFDATTGILNPALIEETINHIQVIVDNTDITLALPESDYPAQATLRGVAAIRSQRDVNGKFCYSPASLGFLGEPIELSIALQSYLKQSGSAASSDYFLDQPELTGKN